MSSNLISLASIDTVRNRAQFWVLLKTLFVLSFFIAGACAVDAQAQEILQTGQAVVTRFSGTIQQDGRRVIDPDGAVASIIDLARPGDPPVGARSPGGTQRAIATARDVGQVFGVALDDATPPNIYLTASAAFGLHRNADNSGWMAGMWGAGGGPGTVWKFECGQRLQSGGFCSNRARWQPELGGCTR